MQLTTGNMVYGWKLLGHLDQLIYLVIVRTSTFYDYLRNRSGDHRSEVIIFNTVRLIDC